MEARRPSELGTAGVKILLGVGRYLVDEQGTRMLQRNEDMLEIAVPDDGTEFLRSVWMIADGLEVLNLPLTMGPAITKFVGFGEHQADDPDEPDTCECACANCSGCTGDLM